MLSPGVQTMSPSRAQTGIYDRSKTKKPDPAQGHFDAYTAAARGQDSDYTDIMNKFRNFYDTAGGSGSGFNLQQDINIPGYQSTADYNSAIKNLSGLAQTGGYSADDISNIRARAVSPIRSVYSSAARNLNRQKSLQGGYSPNMAAATTKMARDMSGRLSDASTSANAQIAQNVAQNRLSAATPYASITAGEQGSRNDFAQRNAEMANKYGFEGKMDNYRIPMQMKLSALQGMTGLYGTTPANTALMQKGAMSFAELQNQINQQNKRSNVDLAGAYR